MVEGARALYDLFERMRVKREALSEEELREIRGVNLSANQERFFDEVVGRAENARRTVRYLEDRFGVDDNLDFVDSEGLHRALFIGKYCPKGIRATSNNFAIGLEKQIWRHGSVHGFARVGFMFDQLRVPVEQTIERIEKGKYTNCADLCFVYPNLDFFKKVVSTERNDLGIEEKLLYSIFEPSVEDKALKKYRDVKEHEIRHVIDVVMGARREYAETPAYMYSGYGFRGLGIDTDNYRDNIGRIVKINEERLENALKYNAPGIYLKSIRKNIRKWERFKEHFEKGYEVAKELVRNIPRDEHEVVSYVFSTLPSMYSGNSVRHLEALNRYYAGKNGK